MRRPVEMQRDATACMACGLCEEIAADAPWREGGVGVTPQTLDAMAACPVGAIVWREDDALAS